MNRSTLTLVVLSVLAAIGSIGWIVAKASPEIQVSHGANAPENRARPSIDPTNGILSMLAQRLSLSPDQKKQVGQMIEAEQPKLNAIHADNSLSPKERQQKMDVTMSELVPKIEAILSSEQRTKFDQLVSDMHSGKMHHG